MATIARSCGILLYRLADAAGTEPTVWLGHMGGPYWARKDLGAWSIPKGEPLAGEADFAAALREFEEEIGSPAPDIDYALLGEFRQPSGKIVVVFLAESDFAVESVTSNLFEIEWPPRSGRMAEFPEIDAAGWFPLTEARTKVLAGLVQVIDALEELLR